MERTLVEGSDEAISWSTPVAEEPLTSTIDRLKTVSPVSHEVPFLPAADDEDDDDEHNNRLVALSLSLLMAAILQAIRSLGNLLHDLVYTLHWNVEQQ